MPIVSLGSITSNLQINPYAVPAPQPMPAPAVFIEPATTADSSDAAVGNTVQPDVEQQAALQNSQAILATGRKAMSEAMQTFAIDWQTEKTRIAAMRPDLMNQKWDFQSDQGTIIVVSNSLSASDVGWLTGILNQDPMLVSDVQTLNKVMVSTFGGTAAMAADDPLGMTLSGLNESTIDGKVNFLALLAGADYESYQAFDASAPNNLSLAAYGSSALNQSSAGEIDAISFLGPRTITRNHQPYQLQADKQMAQTAYADALNDAFQRFLSPAFSNGSAGDGTAVAPDSTSHADLIASLIGAVNNPMGDMTSLSNAAVTMTTQVDGADNAAVEQSLQKMLGPAYRTYGEADAPVPAANGPADTATGAGSVDDIYDDKNATLSPAEESILGPMQALGADWENSKESIATVRPDLLLDGWDFVSDNETVQVVSGNLTTEQRLWLTAKLNQNAALVADTQAVNTDLAAFYQTQYATDPDPLDAVATYGNPAQFDLSKLTPQSIDGRLDYLALMGGENPTEMLVNSQKNGMLLSD